MIRNSKFGILFSVLLFLLMTSFAVSSYALPCHDSEIRVGANSVDNNADFIALNSLSIVQNENDCESCIEACGLCKSHIQTQPVLSYIKGKKQHGFNGYKNYSLLVIPEITLTKYKITYKRKYLYSFSLLLSLQTTLKHRVLLI